jgi:L-alanine-DL-glutamate epimerase-like enolase superfamily enzyme
VPVYASGLDPEGAEAMAARQLALGVTAFKLKVGFGAEADQRAARALREVVGGAARIMVVANQAWTPRQAVAAIAGLAGAGLHWVEEPVRCDDLRGLAEVRRAAGVPTAAGENLYGLAAAQAAVALDAVDVLQPDVSKTGGITESLAVARLADAHGRRCALHFLGGAVGLMASAHVAAAAAGGPLWLELDANPNPLREGLLLDPPAVRDGALLLPAGPGLGIALDPAALRRYGVDLP